MTRDKAKELLTDEFCGDETVTDIWVELDSIIDKIYDDFESRTCESCKYFMDKKIAYLCLFGDTRQHMWIEENIFNSGCNKWEKKDD